jgi:hypothetical protein
MAHLLDANGTPLAVGDGLGIPVDQWQPDDVIVQRHSLAIPSEAPPGTYRVQVGAYTLPDVQRLPIYGDASSEALGVKAAAVGDRMLVGQLEVVKP